MKQTRFGAIALCALLIALLCSAAPSIAEDPQSGFDDPRVQEVVAMASGGLSTRLILTKIEDIGSFPELSGADLVTLSEKGVPEEALLRMIELEEGGTPMPPGKIPVIKPPTPEPPLIIEPELASIRVEIERLFMITFYEVAVDGDVLTHRGKLWKGESEPGQMLRRPSKVGKRKDKVFTALETDVLPGTHDVAAGYAVTWIENDADHDDEWGKDAIEHYVNRGVRALATDEQYQGDWHSPSSVRCSVETGQTCVVKVTLEKRAPTAFGGIPIYSLSYETEIE